MSTSDQAIDQSSSFRRDQVVAIIGSLVNRVRNSNNKVDDALSSELHSLKEAIDALKNDLNFVQPGEIVATHIPKATDELDAIVNTTESATYTIIGACEKIQDCLTNDSGTLSSQIGAEIIRIIEACTFQDITGQRIGKIVKSLRQIDEKTTNLLSVLEERFAKISSTPTAATAPQVTEENSLMNGPQLPGEGISQEEIDKLLAEFN